MKEKLSCYTIRFSRWYGLILCLLLASPAANIFAIPLQNSSRTITGTVFDETSSPMPGVSVLITGTSSGTVTDIDGVYEYPNVPQNGVLVFSFLGYVPQEVSVSSNTVIDIHLQPDTKSLEEVVVVGYGVQKKINVTGAVAAVDGDVLVRRPVANAASMLQGQLPGVRVVQNSGQPG